ncbi:MAG: DUF4174 domain-containing protein [Mongoliibacter sp.]|uniref:DUF4174 domain-containing protein n=1 Tax=Mongoliibacter sp. TaxID=2022438 RepID=UPI0012EFB3B4|nr:DUF4174 domain-containing protein [Mongoliibacter sp.]TVP47348.1 MAG: DUF4174 domain-containing protein [Mongoliibacter sp.]
MNPLYLLLCFFLFSLSQEEPRVLDDFKWKNRVVIYFPQSPQDWTVPNDSLSKEIDDRKIKYFVIEDSVFSNTEVLFTPEYIKKLKNRYAMGSKNSSWVLIGLDGGTKLRKEEGIDWDFIFRTVDAMPMRQSEIRRKGGG